MLRLDDICEIEPVVKSIKKSEFDTAFVGCGSKNNGVIRYKKVVPSYNANKLTISINGTCCDCYYQSLPFSSNNDVAVLDVKLPDITEEQKKALLYYIGACFKIKNKHKFCYHKKLGKLDIKNFEIQLPTKEGIIDFSYLTNLLEKIRNKLINKINKLMYDAV